VEFNVVKIHKPEEVNFILGQSHFIKTVEDIAEAVVGSVPDAKFGLAFSEASGECLIRIAGLLSHQCPECDQESPFGVHNLLCHSKRRRGCHRRIGPGPGDHGCD